VWKAAESFIEVDYYQHCKSGQRIAGDVFLLSRRKEDGRIVCTLSDGLGSGVKANVLANLTATMARKFVMEQMDLCASAEIIMNTLPVCSVRKISYSTFSIADISRNGKARIIEYDNPRALYFRGDSAIATPLQEVPLKRKGAFREETLTLSEFTMQVGDRLVFYSDGVSQSGMGTRSYPLGWRRENLEKAVGGMIRGNPEIGARDLSHAVCNQARLNDGLSARDDITCAVIYFRKPRTLLLVTGPPVEREKDREMASLFSTFTGRKVISGGSTAAIVARELGREVRLRLHSGNDDIPPASSMKGADLVTEGLITLSRLASVLEKRSEPSRLPQGPLRSYMELLLDSDAIHFIVGTKINEAHQDPNVPVEMELRRTIVRRIQRILEEQYLKKTTMRFL
jgi:hypothetical protein